MLRSVLIALLLCLTALPGNAQQLTRFGDNVGTLDGIMKAYYANTTVKKGQSPNFQRDRLLHVPDALVGGISVSRSGKKQLKTMTLKQFHDRYDREMKATGYEEHEIARKVEKFGAVYHVWSTYETRYVAGGPLIGRGIDSIQLYYDGTRFWILSWFYDDERQDNPLPKEYLPH